MCSFCLRLVRWVRAGAIAALGAAYAIAVMAHADALRAAGMNGAAPPNAGAIRTFVSELTDNALWLLGTLIPFTILGIGGLFAFGGSRAPDYAAKFAVGAVVIISAPGIAA